MFQAGRTNDRTRGKRAPVVRLVCDRKTSPVIPCQFHAGQHGCVVAARRCDGRASSLSSSIQMLARSVSPGNTMLANRAP